MRKFKVLRNEVSGVKIFENEKIEINYISMGNVYESDKIFLHEIEDYNTYYSPVISLVGVNASGKTSALKLFSLANELHVSGSSLSTTWLNTKRVNYESLLSSSITLTSYLSIGSELLKVSSELRLSESLEKKYIYEIVEEKIWKKSIKKFTKKNLFSFSEANYITSKTQLEDKGLIVSNDLSMFSYYIKTNYVEFSRKEHKIFNLTSLLGENPFLFENYIDEDYAKYLDPSIEVISIKERNDDKSLFQFKKHTDSEMFITDANTLTNILSSGTRRGLNIMSFVKNALYNGGMVYIDEIESNLNNAIVVDLIKLFYSKQTNPFGAVLVFSSHYTEILDFIKRTDSIYVLEKGKEGILNKLINFNDVIKRKDLKKSEAFISNNLSISSVPQRKLFNKVEHSIIEELNNLKGRDLSES